MARRFLRRKKRTIHRIEVDGSGGVGSDSSNLIRRFTNNPVSIGTYITYEDSVATGGLFTVNKSGIYSITSNLTSTVNSNVNTITLNQTDLTDSPSTHTAIPLSEKLVETTHPVADLPYAASWVGFLDAGDIIRVAVSNSADTSNAGFFKFAIQYIGD